MFRIARILSIFLLLVSFFVKGQSTFQTSYWNTEEYAKSVKQASGNEYIVAGTDESGTNNKAYLLKLDNTGNVLWRKNFGDGFNAYGRDVVMTSDNGFVLVGNTYSSSGAGGSDIFLLKTDAAGNIQWQYTYGSAGNESAVFVGETGSGDLVVVGQTDSIGVGNTDIYFFKTSSTGNLLWTNTYGEAPGNEQSFGASLAPDGDIAVVGVTHSNLISGSFDAYMLEADSTGAVKWAKKVDYGPANSVEEGFSVTPTNDGGFLFGMEPEHVIANQSGGEVAFIKVDASGSIDWVSDVYGWNDNFTRNEWSWEFPNDVIQTPDGGFVAVGVSRWSQTIPWIYTAGPWTAAMYKIDSTGNMEWVKQFGDSANKQRLWAVDLTTDGGLISAGEMKFGGVLHSHVVKTDLAGNAGCFEWGDSPLNVAPGDTILAAPGTSISGGTRQTLSFSVSSISLNDSTWCSQVVNNCPIAGLNAQDVCFGDSVSFSDVTSNVSANAERIWDYGDGVVDTFNTVTNPSHLYSSVGTYQVNLLINDTSCSDSASITINVNSLPNITISSDTLICQGDSAQLFAGGGVDYLWAPGSSLSCDSCSSPFANPSSATNYTVTVTDSLGCSDSDTVTISVASPPNATAGSNSPLCEGDTLLLTSGGGSGYSWTGPGGYSSNQQQAQINGVSTADSGVYIVTVSDTVGCSDTASVLVDVYALPSVGISGPASLCVGDTATLTASGANSFQWNSGDTTSTIQISPSAGSTTYSVTGTNAAGCSDSSSITVTTSPPPNISVSGDSSMCEGNSVKLTASGGTNYSWSNGDTGNSIVVSPSNTTTYWVASSAGTCSDTAYHSITVFPNPSITTSDDQVILKGESVVLEAEGGSQYEWTPETFLDFPDSSSVKATPTETTEYCVRGYDDNGCQDSSCVKIFVEIECGEVFVPDIFSPNNDGNNDLQCVFGNCISENDFLFSIYNRWGEKVFETNDPSECWNGTHKGKEVNAGVFVYKLFGKTTNGQLIEQNGSITVTR